MNEIQVSVSITVSDCRDSDQIGRFVTELTRAGFETTTHTVSDRSSSIIEVQSSVQSGRAPAALARVIRTISAMRGDADSAALQDEVGQALANQR